jgi:hypothetical protein
VRRTDVRLRAIPRFPAQNEKSLLSESETNSFSSGVSGWKLLRDAELANLPIQCRGELRSPCCQWQRMLNISARAHAMRPYKIGKFVISTSLTKANVALIPRKSPSVY